MEDKRERSTMDKGVTLIGVNISAAGRKNVTAQLYNVPVTCMKQPLENDYMITISDEFMQQMLATTRKYCVVILKVGPKRNEDGVEKIIWEHVRRNFALRAEGMLSIVCPISDGSDVTGVGIFNAGSMNINGVSGKMSLVSNAGTIGATQSSLTGDSTFKTNAGSINFNGSMGSTGTYDFETNAGSIDMTLTGNPSFHLNATTDAGSINTSFPVNVNRNTAGATANGDVGTSPQATLTLKTNAGSINLNKG